MKELIDDMLCFVGNDENDLKNREKFRGLLLYLIKLERGFKGWCSNSECCCQTKNIIKKYLEDTELKKFLSRYKILERIEEVIE